MAGEKKKGKRGWFLNLNPNEKKQILCVWLLSEHPWQIRLLIHKCPDLCLCNYSFLTHSSQVSAWVSVCGGGCVCQPHTFLTV